MRPEFEVGLEIVWHEIEPGSQSAAADCSGRDAAWVGWHHRRLLDAEFDRLIRGKICLLKAPPDLAPIISALIACELAR